MDLQVQIAEDTTLFKSLKYDIIGTIPRFEYTETVERIFSSNIESINTVGNVLFTEMVSEFYLTRKQYKTEICDSIFNEVKRTSPFESLKDILDFDFYFYALISGLWRYDMQQKYANCKKIMGVTDEQLNVYISKRESLEKGKTDGQQVLDSLTEKFGAINQRLEVAKKKLKLE